MAVEPYGRLNKHQAKAVVLLGTWTDPALSTVEIARRLRVDEFEVYNLLARENKQLGLRLVQ